MASSAERALDDGDGFVAGVAQAIDAAGPLLPLRDATQLALLPGDAVHSIAVHRAPRGRGRPAGAGNKRTEAVRSYLLSRYAHPLEVLAQIYSRPTDVLAAELGCGKDEALALQVKAAAEVAPYVEGKMPVSIDITKRSDVVIVMPRPGESVEEAGERLQAGDPVDVDWSAVEVEEMAEISHSEGGE